MKKIKLLISVILVMLLSSCSPRFSSRFVEGEFIGEALYGNESIILDDVSIKIEQIKLIFTEISKEEYLSRKCIIDTASKFGPIDIDDNTIVSEYKYIFYKNAIKNLADNKYYDLKMFLKFEGEDDFINYDIVSEEAVPYDGPKNTYYLEIFSIYKVDLNISMQLSFNQYIIVDNKISEISFSLRINRIYHYFDYNYHKINDESTKFVLLQEREKNENIM